MEVLSVLKVEVFLGVSLKLESSRRRSHLIFIADSIRKASFSRKRTLILDSKKSQQGARRFGKCHGPAAGSMVMSSR